MRRRTRRGAAAMPALLLGCGSLALGACLLPSYTLDTSSTGDTSSGAGGTGGATTTDSTGAGAEGGGGAATTSTGAEGGGGAGGATTTSTTTSTPCANCPEWALSFGSALSDGPRALAVNTASQIAVGGTHQGPFTFPSGLTVSHGGGTDGFLGTLSPSGAGALAIGLRGDSNGADEQVVSGVLFDAAGVVVAGHFSGSLTLKPGTTLPSFGGTDAFVARYDTAGTLVWSRHLHGSGNERALAIAFDPAGNVVVAGTYTGTPIFDADPLPGHGPGTADCFLLKLGAGGAVVPPAAWPIRSWGTTDDDVITGLAVDPNGKVVVVGDHKKNIGFDDGQVPSLQNSSMDADGYLLRFTAAGAYETPIGLGGQGAQHVYGVAISASGSVLVAGTFLGSMSVGGLSLQNQDPTPDLFVARFEPTGSVTWAAPIPNVDIQPPLALAAAPDGGAVLAGGYSGTADFLSGISTTAAGFDPFVVRLDALGNYVKHRVWSAAGTQLATALAVDGTGALVLGGQLSEPIDFGAGGPLPVNGSFDVFLLRMPLSAL